MVEGVASGAAGRPTDHVAVGVLTSTVPRAVVDAAIAAHDRRELRCRKLPAHVMADFAMAMCLFPNDYEEVATKLRGVGLRPRRAGQVAGAPLSLASWSYSPVPAWRPARGSWPRHGTQIWMASGSRQAGAK